MMKHERPLQNMVRATHPMLLEAPSSWLSRLALTQGAEIGEVLSHLKLHRRGDIDLVFATQPLAELMRVIGADFDQLAPAVRILRNIAAIDPEGRKFLWRSKGAAQFFYCPHCLKSQATSHIPIHWRVRTWRHCPIHQCLLETGCPHCQAATVLPQNMLMSGPKRQGVAFLKHCGRCDKALTGRDPFCLRTHGQWALSAFDWCLLQNGRAALASLYTGDFYVHGSELNEGLQGLMSFQRRGLLPSKLDWLATDLLRRRLATRAGEAQRHGEEALLGDERS